MNNAMNPDDQLANYIDGLAPAISLDDITRISRSEITVLPTSLEGEQITMNDQYDEYSNTPDSIPEIVLIDRAAAKRRNRFSVWAGGAVAAAAAVAVIGYTLSGTNGAKTTTATDSTAASEFTESDGGAGAPEGSDQNSSEVASSLGMSSGYVIRAEDGSFLNYITTYSESDDSSKTIVERSTDGETWEPVEPKGFPPGQLIGITPNDGLFVATAYEYDMYDPAAETNSHTAVSTDGLNWTEIAAPETTAEEGLTSQLEVSGAARLADGRYLVAGMQFSTIDYEALGIDGNDICGEGTESSNQVVTEQEDGTMTGTIEIQHCDGTSETVEMPMSSMGDASNLLWTVEADGTNPTLVSPPRQDLVPGYAGITGTDGVAIVTFTNNDNPGLTTVGTTRDAVTWETEDRPAGESEATGQSTSYNGTTYRTSMLNNGTQNIERSNDGGKTWTTTAPLGENDSVQLIAAGPAGVVAVASDFGDMELPTFDYLADDGTHLTGEIPEGGETTWVLTTPAGDTFEYQLDGSIFDPTTPDPSRNVTVEMTEAGEPVFTVLSPEDGSTLLTVSVTELYASEAMTDETGAGMDAIEEAMNTFSAAAEKDGYTLSLDGVDGDSASYTLTGPDGTELLNGSLDDQGNPSGDGVEISGEAMMPSMRFFDPATGEDYVTFTAMDLKDAFMSAATTAMERVSAPFTLSQDGYTLAGTIPAGEWNVTDADGKVIATFQSPIYDSYMSVGSPNSPEDDAVRSVDPLTKDVTILDNGNPLVTFTYADIVAAAGDIMEGFASGSEGAIYFSADQGATWTQVSPINGWVISAAVGDDEVLLTTDAAMAKPLRLALPVN